MTLLEGRLLAYALDAPGRTLSGGTCRPAPQHRTTLFGPHAAASRDVVLADLIWAFCGGRVAPELLGWMFGDSSQSQAEAEVGAPFAEWRHSDVPYLAAAVHLHTLRTGSTRQAAEAPCTGSAASSSRHHKQQQEAEVEWQRARSYALLDQIRAVGGFAFDGACVGTFLRAVWLAVTVLGGQGQELMSWLLDRGCPTGPVSPGAGQGNAGQGHAVGTWHRDATREARLGALCSTCRVQNFW